MASAGCCYGCYCHWYCQVDNCKNNIRLNHSVVADNDDSGCCNYVYSFVGLHFFGFCCCVLTVVVADYYYYYYYYYVDSFETGDCAVDLRRYYSIFL
jgi:hypothetical protein